MKSQSRNFYVGLMLDLVYGTQLIIRHFFYFLFSILYPEESCSNWTIVKLKVEEAMLKVNEVA